MLNKLDCWALVRYSNLREKRPEPTRIGQLTTMSQEVYLRARHHKELHSALFTMGYFFLFVLNETIGLNYERFTIVNL
jgi:hypothetical protein